MSTKQTEALKLALEALESCSAGDYSTGHVIHPSFDVDAVNKAIDAVDEALAEQPPCKTGSQCTSKCPQCEQPDGMHHNKPHKCKYPKCPYPCPDLPDCRDAEQPAQPERIQLAVKDFVTTVGGIEDAVGTPTYWAEWPNKKHEPTIDLDKYAGTYGGYIKEQK